MNFKIKIKRKFLPIHSNCYKFVCMYLTCQDITVLVLNMSSTWSFWEGGTISSPDYSPACDTLLLNQCVLYLDPVDFTNEFSSYWKWARNILSTFMWSIVNAHWQKSSVILKHLTTQSNPRKQKSRSELSDKVLSHSKNSLMIKKRQMETH